MKTMNSIPENPSTTPEPWSGDRQGFWVSLDRLVKDCRIVIDRPKGSSHPSYPEAVYPLDYGYLDGTLAQDQAGIDVWLGSLSEKTLDGLVFTVDLKKRDAEMKLLLGCNEAEMQTILRFLNGDSMRAILVRRQQTGVDLLLSRRSVRRFQSRPVEQAVIRRILEAATYAPSSHNRQPWRFAVLSTQEARRRLADSMGADFRRDLIADGLGEQEVDAQVQRSRQRILEAPLAILLCLDARTGDQYPDKTRQQAEYLMGVQSVAMAGQNLLLAAHANGLGGVWVCAPLFARQTVRLSLDLPTEWDPQGLLLLGYPAKIPVPRPRRPVEEVSVFIQ
jgi:coenzyme F420-0:L-glutamate ligase/coenzyme F420-1:gamma-L-glutamate ligase